MKNLISVMKYLILGIVIFIICHFLCNVALKNVEVKDFDIYEIKVENIKGRDYIVVYSAYGVAITPVLDSCKTTKINY